MVQIGSFLVNIWLIVVIVLGIGAFLGITIVLGIRAHRFKLGAGVEELVGKTAVAKTPLAPKGQVFIEGELWAAKSESGQVEAGEEVVITRVDGMTLYVTKT